MYKCKLCSEFTGWVTLRRAIVHEDGRSHVQRYRELDRAHPLTSPLIDDTPLPSPQSYHIPGPAIAPIDPQPQPISDFDPEDIAAIITIPGPALPDDDPNEIYDAWGGAFGEEMLMSEPERPYVTSEGLDGSGVDDDRAGTWGVLEDPLEWEEQHYTHYSDGKSIIRPKEHHLPRTQGSNPMTMCVSLTLISGGRGEMKK